MSMFAKREVCPNSSIPPPGPPRSYGGEKDSKDGGAEGGWWGQLQAWSGPACTLRVPGVRKRTIADPQSPEPSESPARAFLPSSSKFSAEAGRVQNRGPGGARRRADRAGGTGSRLGVPRTPRREWRGLVIHSHPRSLRTYPYPSRPDPAVDVTGDRSKVGCCKQHYCIGTWNVRSMNQGTLEFYIFIPLSLHLV